MTKKQTERFKEPVTVRFKEPVTVQVTTLPVKEPVTIKVPTRHYTIEVPIVYYDAG
jgi:hypothetical protein